MSKKAIREMDRHNDEMSVMASADRFNRARSITVGTAMNGAIEMMMRADGKHIWATLSPVEVVELIHQMAAGIGCHIHMQPRNDFASWRNWRHADGPNGNGFPPFNVGFPELPQQEEKLSIETEPNGKTLAIEAPKQRRRAKRAAATT